MDSYTQALDEPKRLAQRRLADLILLGRESRSCMIVVGCCGEIAADLCKLLKSWRGRRDSNSRPLP